MFDIFDVNGRVDIDVAHANGLTYAEVEKIITKRLNNLLNRIDEIRVDIKEKEDEIKVIRNTLSYVEYSQRTAWLSFPDSNPNFRRDDS